MNQVGWVLVGWVALCVLGIVINWRFLMATLGDRQFLRTHKLNGVREELVDIHFRDAFSRLVVKVIFAIMGLWSLALRAGNDAPLTPTGWLVFGTFYLILGLMTLTDGWNFNARLTLVKRLLAEGVVMVEVPAPEPIPPPPPAPAQG